MKLAIKSLSLSNFKGVKQLNLMFDNTEVKIYGANGSGKSTVGDSHCFAVTGNDSSGSKCDTVTLDADNNKVYGANEVIEVLVVDGVEITLGRKVITKLGKSKGEEVEKTIYEYTVNGAPLKATEYEAYIREHITKGRIDSKEFLILTNPTAFQELPWEKQREFLYKIAGDITDDEVINQHEEYEFLRDFLKISDIKSYRTTANKKIKEVEIQINKLQGVIEEKERTQAPAETIESLTNQKSMREAQINTLKESLKGSNEIMDKLREKQKCILEIESLREREKASYESKYSNELDSKRERIKTITGRICVLESEIEHLKELVSLNDEIIFNIHGIRDKDNKDLIVEGGQVTLDFRKTWDKVITATLRESDTKCPTCGHELEGNQLEDVKNSFESRREAKKTELVNEAKANNSKVAAARENVARSTKEIELKAAEAMTLSAEKEAIEEAIKVLESSTLAPFDTTSFDEEIKEVQAEIDSLVIADTSEVDARIEALRCEITDITFNIDEVNRYIALQREIGLKKSELKEMQLTLADDIRKVELSKDFSICKAEMLEGKINSMFEKVQFKLFETQKNGEVKETCTALAKGSNGALVDLKSGYANTALRIQAGIEIINALQKHFDFYCPIFVDNRESVTGLPAVDTQVISLVVDDSCKEVTIK